MPSPKQGMGRGHSHELVNSLPLLCSIPASDISVHLLSQPRTLTTSSHCLQESWKGKVGGWEAPMGRELGLAAGAVAGTVVGWNPNRTGMGWWVRKHGNGAGGQSSTEGGHPNQEGNFLTWGCTCLGGARPGHRDVFPRLNASNLSSIAPFPSSVLSFFSGSSISLRSLCPQNKSMVFHG